MRTVGFVEPPCRCRGLIAPLSYATPTHSASPPPRRVAPFGIGDISHARPLPRVRLGGAAPGPAGCPRRDIVVERPVLDLFALLDIFRSAASLAGDIAEDPVESEMPRPRSNGVGRRCRASSDRRHPPNDGPPSPSKGRPPRAGRRRSPRRPPPPRPTRVMRPAGGLLAPTGHPGPQKSGLLPSARRPAPPSVHGGARPPRKVSLWGREGGEKGLAAWRRPPVRAAAARLAPRRSPRPEGPPAAPGGFRAGPRVLRQRRHPPARCGRPALRGRAGRGLHRAASMRPVCLIIHIFTVPEFPCFTGFSARQAR